MAKPFQEQGKGRLPSELAKHFPPACLFGRPAGRQDVRENEEIPLLQELLDKTKFVIIGRK